MTTTGELLALALESLEENPAARVPCPTCGYVERALDPVERAELRHSSGRTFSGPLVLIRCARCRADLAVYTPPEQPPQEDPTP